MTELNQNTFSEKISAKTPVVVDFWAEWCMPCKIFAPVLEELSDEMDGEADFYKLNVDDCADIAREYGIASIPTLVIFKDGSEQTRLVGVLPKERVEEAVRQYI